MAADGYVELVIVQGEDWTCDLIWTDQADEPVSVVHPCRMDIKGLGGSTLITLETDPDIPDGDIPSIALSSQIGFLQLHIPRAVTGNFAPGVYTFDLFASVDDDDEYAGDQATRLIYGPAEIQRRTTVMT